MKLLLDTHALVWAMQDDARLGKRARQTLDRAQPRGEITMSAISFFELALLIERRKLTLQNEIGSWRRQLNDAGVVELAISGEIALRAAALNGTMRDPLDRLIVATALAEDCALMTADRTILQWPGKLERVDAAR